MLCAVLCVCVQALSGVVLNLLCIIVVVFGIHTWGAGVFDLQHVIRTDDGNLTAVNVTLANSTSANLASLSPTIV